MIGAKSYNKLPRFLPRFIVYLVVVEAMVAAASATVLPGLITDVVNLVESASTTLKAAVEINWLRTGTVVPALALLAIALAAAMAARDVKNFHSGAWLGEKPSPSATYGSARLLSRPRDLRRRFYVWRKGTSPKPGVVVGGIGSNRNKLLVETGKKHLLLLGGTGSGKTTSVLLPSQMCLLESGTSTFTLDPKGEISAICGRSIVESGARLVVIDFSDARRSDGWLPLQPAIDCVTGACGRSRDKLAGELRILSGTLIPERRESSSMWTQAARIMFGGLAGFAVESDLVPARFKNLSTVAALAAMPQETMQQIVDALPPSSPSRLQLSEIAYAPAETFGGFAVNLNTALSVYADPSVSPMLARSDFRPEDYLDGQCCVFVKFSSSTEAFNPLIAAYVEQMVDSLRRLAENRCGGTLPKPIYFLLEELPQLPKVSLGKTLAICRSQNIFVTCCIQSRSMLQAVYREDSAGMFDSMSTTLFLQASDTDTNKHYSEALGSYTVETETRSSTRGTANGSSTKSYSYHEARLFRPEDLAKWGYDTGHLIIQGGQALACSSLPLSKTFVGDSLGLNGEEPDAEKRNAMTPERPIKNTEPAPIWTWDDLEKRTAVEGIASAIAEAEDPRYL